MLKIIKQNPDAIKYVHEDIKRDPELLIAAGMFGVNHDVDRNDDNNRRLAQKLRHQRKIVLSTRFALKPSSHSQATNFTQLLKEHEYIRNGNFKIYAPNAFDKHSCDPNWTDFDWPCRGTKETCCFEDTLKTGHPTDDCCWRYSFRYQLEEAKATGGFMLQLVETEEPYSDGPPVLGNGQRIEQHMSQQLQLKTFHVYRPMFGYEQPFEKSHIEQVVTAIKYWYDGECQEISKRVCRPTSG